MRERTKMNMEIKRELHRYLFLNTECLISIEHCKYLSDNNFEEEDEFGPLFDPEAIDNLSYIINKIPDLKIIITSSCRLNGWDWINKIWEKRNLPGKIYSITPEIEEIRYTNKINGEKRRTKLSYETRGLEIREWLEQNVKDDINYFYAIIDDNYELSVRQLQYTIECEIYEWLDRKRADMIIEKLHLEYEEEIENNIINLDHVPLSNISPSRIHLCSNARTRKNKTKG